MLKSALSIALLWMLLVSIIPAAKAFHTTRPEIKTVTGFLCHSEYGSHMGTDCIQTKTGTVCYETQASVKYIGFKSKRAHEIGAEYRVTMDSGGGGYYALKIVFTGRFKPTQPCQSS
jgi:hypothetical protein